MSFSIETAQPLHIHILGICGTFMGSLALLAKELDHHVSGSDLHVYPPMSTQLESQGIQLIQGYDPANIPAATDLVIIGNAMSRGNPSVEHVLNSDIRYTSGPAFFAEFIVPQRWVLGVSGTHGKTSTSSMLAWILEYAGMKPGFLIGGIAQNFGISARLGDTPFFVIEADEYDTAFFDKRSKFVHYHPKTLILNNLEFDHADIFENLAAIQKQFHHMIRAMPSLARIIHPAQVAAVDATLQMGCWSETESVSNDSNTHSTWQSSNANAACSHFEVLYQGESVGTVSWQQEGEHNMANALAAIAAAHHVGILPSVACEALASFKGVKRRMELIAEVEGVRIYDDFAHHPTAIATTLAGQRNKYGKNANIRTIIELRSNTMKMGVHQQSLVDAIAFASEVIWFVPEPLEWPLVELIEQSGINAKIMDSTAAIVQYCVDTAQAGDHLLIMSNGGFEGIHHRIVDALSSRKWQ